MEQDNQANVPTARPCGCMLDFALLLNRLSLGLLFFLAGLGKLRMGVSEFYDKFYLPLKPPWLPELLSRTFGHTLPYAELAIGALLIIGLVGRLAAGLMVLLLTAITIALWQKGMFFSGGAPFHTNVILLTLAFLLAVTGPGLFSVDRLIKRICTGSTTCCCE